LFRALLSTPLRLAGAVTHELKRDIPAVNAAAARAAFEAIADK
jgi:hypothetical protein